MLVFKLEVPHFKYKISQPQLSYHKKVKRKAKLVSYFKWFLPPLLDLFYYYLLVGYLAQLAGPMGNVVLHKTLTKEWWAIRCH